MRLKIGEGSPLKCVRVLNGDGEDITPEQWALVTDNLGLCWKMISVCRVPPHRAEDVYSGVCLPALINAARAFKPELGKFSSLAALSMKRAIWHHLQRLKKERIMMQHFWRIRNVIPKRDEGEEEEIQEENLIKLRETILTMPVKMRTVMSRHLQLETISQVQTAQEMGLGLSKAWWIERKAKKVLKKLLEGV